jgi:transposase
MPSNRVLPLFDTVGPGLAKRRRKTQPNLVAAQPDFLDLLSLKTLRVDAREHCYEVEAEPFSRPQQCPRCGNSGDSLHRHDRRQKKIKDCKVRERQVLICLYWYRYKCSDCGQVTRPQLEGIDTRRNITCRLRERIERESLLANKSFRMVAQEQGVDEKTVRNLFTKYIKKLARVWRFEAPRFLGIDEVYIDGVARCVLTDVENRRLINILPKRDMLTLRRHLLQIKHPERVVVVTIDMWRAYYEEALKRFPGAVIVIDKYHVLRMATDGVISVHRRLRRRDGKLRMPKLYLLRKRKHTLPQGKLKELEKRLEELPELKEAHGLKETFFNIWNSLDRREAEQRFHDWVREIPPHLQDDFKELLRALENWLPVILNYFDHRLTNAFTESINCVIKQMQRIGRGYTFQVTRAKLLYGGRFSAQRATVLPGTGDVRRQTTKAVKRKKKADRSDAPTNPQANVQQLERIRRSEDEFNELMRMPAGYVERFSHFNQLDFNF